MRTGFARLCQLEDRLERRLEAEAFPRREISGGTTSWISSSDTLSTSRCLEAG